MRQLLASTPTESPSPPHQVRGRLQPSLLKGPLDNPSARPRTPPIHPHPNLPPSRGKGSNKVTEVADASHAAGGRHCPRLHAGHGRALLHDALGRHGRRRHQGREARRRRLPPHGPALHRRRVRRLPRHQPQQEEHRPRPAERGRPQRLPPHRPAGRRRRRELPPRRDGAARPRPRADCASRAPGAHLRLHLRLRADRPLREPPRLRPARAGHVRHDERHRLPRTRRR